MSEQILRDALERIVALHDRTDIVEAWEIAEAALASQPPARTIESVVAKWHAEPDNGSIVDLGLRVLDAYRESQYVPQPPTRTISNITELYVFASNGMVNTCKRGEANTTQTRTTAEVELAIGQRMVIERGDGVLKLEVLPDR